MARVLPSYDRWEQMCKEHEDYDPKKRGKRKDGSWYIDLTYAEQGEIIELAKVEKKGQLTPKQKKRLDALRKQWRDQQEWEKQLHEQWAEEDRLAEEARKKHEAEYKPIDGPIPSWHTWRKMCEIHPDYNPTRRGYFKDGVSVYKTPVGIGTFTEDPTQTSYALQRAEHKALMEQDPIQATVLNAVPDDRRRMNENYIAHSVRLSNLPHISLSDPMAIRGRTDFFFGLCIADGIRPNLAGYALSLGTTVRGLERAMSDRRMTREASEEIGRGMSIIEDTIINLAFDGYLSPVNAIFFLKNHYGYTDQSDVNIRAQAVEQVDTKALEQKYQTVIDIEG